MLKIIRAKPNPAGKDRLRHVIAPRSLLSGEWIDIKNEGRENVHLNGLQIWTVFYSKNKERMQIVMQFNLGENDILLPDKIIRVHSGKEIPPSELCWHDREGADYHVFTHTNYIWNNNEIDQPSIWDPKLKKWIDETWYEPKPPEGAILIRNNEKLTVKNKLKNNQ